MSEILKRSYDAPGTDLPTYEDIENLYDTTCPYCGEVFEDVDICPDCEAEGHIEELEYEPAEIFEWWIVTGRFYEKLKEKGQPVLEWGNNYYWGRCTTGQAILLDYVVSQIAEDMEILEGQSYSWADKI
jgi:hypothetical protein